MIFVLILNFSNVVKAGVEKTEDQVNKVSAKEINAASEKSLGLAVSPAGLTVGSIASPGMTTALELRNSNLNSVLPSDSWISVRLEILHDCSDMFNFYSFLRFSSSPSLIISYDLNID